MMRLKYIPTVMASLLIANSALAFESETENLKKAVVAKFLKEANDMKSILGQSIARINEETSDGRNHEGTIMVPIKSGQLQVVQSSAQYMMAPWRYSDKKDGVCRATGDSAQFLIFLSQEQGVHSASEFGTIVFSVSAREQMSARILTKNPEAVFCDDIVSERGSKDFGKVQTKISVSEIKKVELSIK